MKIVITLFAVLISTHGFVYSQDAGDPPRGLSELEAYSIFYDSFRTGNYPMALEYGEWIVESKPRTLEGYGGFSLETQLRRMVTVYTEAANSESDITRQREYLEKAKSIFPIIEEEFSEEEIDQFTWTMREGRFYHENMDRLDDVDVTDVIDTYTAAFELDAERFVSEGDGYYIQVLLNQLADSGERDQAFEMIERIEPYANEELMSTVDVLRQSLFENPQERIDFVESRIESAQGEERTEMLTDLLGLYEQTGNNERISEIALELYEINPTYEYAKAVADGFMSDGDYSGAIPYLTEAGELAEEVDERKTAALDLAEANLRTGRYQQARSSARNALSVDSGAGEAYMKIAEIYSDAVTNCVDGGTLDRRDRTVYWLILDYLEQAKQVDSSLARLVDGQISVYEEVMPSPEDKFFMSWNAGESFMIDGSVKECYAWINESTRIR